MITGLDVVQTLLLILILVIVSISLAAYNLPKE